jgi:hypothetical protein
MVQVSHILQTLELYILTTTHVTVSRLLFESNGNIISNL